jgi:hypothetical protein
MVVVMTTATTPTLETFIRQIIDEVIQRVDFTQLKEAKLAYSPEEVATLAGFKNGLAVIREAQAGRLIGSKVRNNWRFTPERIREYLEENEVPV